MKSKFFFAVYLLVSSGLNAQDGTILSLKSETSKQIKKDAAVDTLKKVWKKGGVYSLNIGQSSLSNWAAGGDDFSFSVNSFLNLYAFYKKGKQSWDNTFDLNLGFINTTSQGSRKNDDRFDFMSKYGHALSEKWNVSSLFNFRSQFFKGHKYLSDNEKTLVSAFLSPAYILVSIGMDYKPAKNLSIFISPVTSRTTIVQDDYLSSVGSYGVEPGNKSISEFGAFASVSYMKAISKTIAYKGRMDLFSNYKHNPQNLDLLLTNIFSAKFSKSLAFNWSLDMIYDDDVKLFGPQKTSPALQVKSIIGVGLTLKF